MRISLNVHDVVRVEAKPSEHDGHKWTEVTFYGAEDQALLSVAAFGADQTRDLPMGYVVRVES